MWDGLWGWWLSCAPLLTSKTGVIKGVWTPIPLHLAVNTAVGPIAQSVEQRTFNPWVDGSSPSGPTMTIQALEINPLLLRYFPLELIMKVDS